MPSSHRTIPIVKSATLTSASRLRYIEHMKTATLPSLRVEPSFRAEVEAVLGDGESLSEFVEAAVRAGVQRRRIGAEFMARGMDARAEAQRNDDHVDAAAVLAGLQQKLDAARRRASRRHA